MRSKRLAAVTIVGIAMMLGLPMSALADDYHHHWHHDFAKWGKHENGWNHKGQAPNVYNSARPNYSPNGYAPVYNPGYRGYSAPAYGGGYSAPAYGGYGAPVYGGYAAPAFGGYGAPAYAGDSSAPYGAGAPGCGPGMQHLMQMRGLLNNQIAQESYARNWNDAHRLNTQLEYTNKLIYQNGGGAACGPGAGNIGLTQNFMPNRGYTAPTSYNRYNTGYNGNGGFASANAYNAYGRPSGYNGNYRNGAYANNGVGSMLAPFIR